MEKKGNFANDIVYSLQIAGLVAVTLLLALPVYMHMKRASNIENAISQERRESFINENAELKNLDRPAPGSPTAGIDTGQRTTRYDTGSAILTVSPQNIARLSPDDFRKVGETPYSLINTVGGNQNIPNVVSVVFDNRSVVTAFLARPTTQALLNNSAKVAEMVKNNDPVIARFFANAAVVETLDNEPMMLAISNSALMHQILQSPSGQYFIKNPAIARQLANGNKAIAPLIENKSLRKFLEVNPQTREAAAEFFK